MAQNIPKSLHFLLFSLFFVTISWSQSVENREAAKRIIAYVSGWEKENWGDDFEKAKMITHINYAFANIKDGKVIAGHADDAEVLKKLNALKAVHPELKILISVGGWSWSGNFSDAVLTEASREIFANSAIAFMQSHDLDGIDLDWEYPGQLGAGNVFRPEDNQNFTEILKLLRSKLDALATPDKKYQLTIATGANQNYLDHTNLGETQQYLDFLNIMTYDFYTAGGAKTGHHANLLESGFDTTDNPRSANLAVQQHLRAGVPAEKIVLGVPFYGRWWKGALPENNGLYQESIGERGSLDYKNIEDSIDQKFFNVKWDSLAQSPYIFRKRDSLFITYDNPRSLALKVNYVNKNELGGIMFWEFNGDNGELLESIFYGLQKENK